MRELHITERQFYEELSPAIVARLGFMHEMDELAETIRSKSKG